MPSGAASRIRIFTTRDSPAYSGSNTRVRSISRTASNISCLFAESSQMLASWPCADAVQTTLNFIVLADGGLPRPSCRHPVPFAPIRALLERRNTDLEAEESLLAAAQGLAL